LSIQLPHLPSYTLFPYTTLFRSCVPSDIWQIHLQQSETLRWPRSHLRQPCKEAFRIAVMSHHLGIAMNRISGTLPAKLKNEATRSEEHTSELQSRENLVCRLLLE